MLIFISLSGRRLLELILGIRIGRPGSLQLWLSGCRTRMAMDKYAHRALRSSG
jgi:hypothetical protein